MSSLETAGFFSKSWVKYLAAAIAGLFAGDAAVLLHRFLINWEFPVGFVLAVLLLFSGGICARAYLGLAANYAFAIAVSVSIYALATLTSGDILILGGGLAGEKPWAGSLGWVLILGSAVFAAIPSFLPEKLFATYRYPLTFSAGDSELSFMLELAQATDLILINAFESRKFRTDLKADGTPVTEVDRAVEAYIRDQIAKRFPDDQILGEEFGESNSGKNARSEENGTSHARADALRENSNSGEQSNLGENSNSGKNARHRRRWIVDPIDGTKNFVRGVPIFATLIALEIDGKVVKSAVSAPALKRRWWGISAGEKRAAWEQFDQLPPRRIQVSQIAQISEASVAISSRGGWASRANTFCGESQLAWFDSLCQKAARVRGFGDFYSYMLLAAGAVDAATEPDLELYDIAALIPIVEGAGGIFTDLEGSSWSDQSGLKSSLASNSAIRASLPRPAEIAQ